MPELPEVQTVVSTLQPRITGLTIHSALLHRADIVHPAAFNLPSSLSNRTIRAITRRGKRIVFLLDNDIRFYIHLGMTGQLTLEDPSAPHRPHTHLVVNFHPRATPQQSAASLPDPTSFQLRFRDPRRFGGIFLLSNDDPDPLGPEPLTLSSTTLHQRLQHSARPIKNALMDQHVIAGLGNIYVDESLFDSRIHPLTPADVLTPAQTAALNKSIKKILRRAIRHRGSTLRDYRTPDQAEGGFQNLHQVYGRESKPCTTCKTPISRIVLQGRSTHFCSKCQRPARSMKKSPKKRPQ